MTIIQIEIDTMDSASSRVRSRIIGELTPSKLTDEKKELLARELDIAHRIAKLVNVGMMMTGGAVPCDENGNPISK